MNEDLIILILGFFIALVVFFVFRRKGGNYRPSYSDNEMVEYVKKLDNQIKTKSN